MLNLLGLIAAALAVWCGWEHEWLPAGIWAVTALGVALFSVWLRAARRAWRD